MILSVAVASSGIEDAEDAARALIRKQLDAPNAAEHADLWITASILRIFGERQLALQIAHIAPKSERSSLLKYVRSDARAGKESVDQLISAGRATRRNPSRALDLLNEVDVGSDPVLSVYRSDLRAAALKDLDLPGQANAKIQAAKTAHAIGWHSKRDHLLRYIAFERILDNECDAMYIEESTLVYNRRVLRAGERLVVYGVIEGEMIGIVVSPNRDDFIPLGKAEPILKQVSQAAELRKKGSADKIRRLLIDPLRLGDCRVLDIIPQSALQFVPFSALCPTAATTLWPHRPGLIRNFAREGEKPKLSIDVSSLRPLKGCRPVDLKDCLARRVRYRAVYVRLDMDGRFILHRDGAIHLQDFLAGCDTDLVVFACDGSARFVRPVERARDAFDKLSDALGDLQKGGGERTRRKMLKRTDAAMSELEKQLGSMQWGRQSLMSKSCPSFLVNVWTGGPEAAEQFLNRFHAHWILGKPVPVCLANAQREMRGAKEWSDPINWAGWQVWGRR